MPNYRRAKANGGSYFFTVVSKDRQAILTQAAIRLALRTAIEHTRQRFPFDIDGWVLLPDHLHCIWTLPADDHDYSRRWSMIKRLTTKNAGIAIHQQGKRREGQLWQRRFWEHQIRDEHDYQTHMEYLHWNPVKHGHLQKVSDWPWSSFHRYVKHRVYPDDWGGYIEQQNDSGFGE